MNLDKYPKTRSSWGNQIHQYIQMYQVYPNRSSFRILDPQSEQYPGIWVPDQSLINGLIG